MSFIPVAEDVEEANEAQEKDGRDNWINDRAGFLAWRARVAVRPRAPVRPDARSARRGLLHSSTRRGWLRWRAAWVAGGARRRAQRLVSRRTASRRLCFGWARWVRALCSTRDAGMNTVDTLAFSASATGSPRNAPLRAGRWSLGTPAQRWDARSWSPG